MNLYVIIVAFLIILSNLYLKKIPVWSFNTAGLGGAGEDHNEKALRLMKIIVVSSGIFLLLCGIFL